MMQTVIKSLVDGVIYTCIYVQLHIWKKMAVKKYNITT